MSTRQTRTAARQARTIQSVDQDRAAADPFKFPAFLRTTLDTDLQGLDDADAQVNTERGGDVSSSPKVRAAKDQLGILLRECFRLITGIPSYQLDANARQGVLEAYGWKGGQIGTLDDTRILEMADDAVGFSEAGADEEKPAWLLPAEMIALIKVQLAIVDSFETEAGGGSAQGAIKRRNPLLAKLQRTNARCRFYYFCASDDVDKTPELVKINHQPRRPRQKKAVNPGGSTPAKPAATEIPDKTTPPAA